MTSDTLAMLFPNVAVTCGISVRVAVSFLAEQSDPATNRWFWSYHVRIENGSDVAVQLLSRTGTSPTAAARSTRSRAKAWSGKCR